MNKKALIFGGSGQDGSYMCKFLLEKKYEIISVTRNLNKKSNHQKIKIKKGVLRKKINIYKKIEIEKLINSSQCDEIYFFSGQPSPLKSYKQPYETIISSIIPVYYILEVIKNSKKKIKFFNASSCEIFASSKKKKSEKSKKEPSSPYGLSKLITLYFTKFYREQYKLKCFSSIGFHHESILRKKNFLIPKIIDAAKKISINKKRKLYLGNINNIKDWGWAPEHVSLIYRIMQKNISGDFVIGTGKSVSIRYLLNHVFKTFNLNWKEFVVLDKKYIRAIDVNESRADISKIKFFLKWTPKFYVEDVVKKLILNEI
tara:strand:+ start:61 stop:1005 length:945 start_codon:yes stop_codon:yes gene_type:complete